MLKRNSDWGVLEDAAGDPRAAVAWGPGKRAHLLRALRVARGWTLEAMAGVLGMSDVRTLRRWEDWRDGDERVPTGPVTLACAFLAAELLDEMDRNGA